MANKEIQLPTQEDLAAIHRTEQKLDTVINLLNEGIPSNTEEILTEREAQDYLKVSAKTMYNYRSKGLSYFQVQKAIRYRKSDLDKFINKHRV